MNVLIAYHSHGGMRCNAHLSSKRRGMGTVSLLAERSAHRPLAGSERWQRSQRPKNPAHPKPERGAAAWLANPFGVRWSALGGIVISRQDQLYHQTKR